MFKLLMSALRRVVTAVSNPFRMLLVRGQRLFNINILTAKLVRPLTKKVRELITLRPQSRKDYMVVGRWWIYKKLFFTVLLALCAGVFIYFSIYAPRMPAVQSAAAVVTNISYDYNDMKLREFTGTANIRAADGQIIYTGDIKSGVCSGNGTLLDRKGRLEYRGGFAENQFSGDGVYYFPDGKKKYEGQWAQNLYSGEGILYAEDGTTQLYSGGFRSGLYEGEGKAWSINGTLLYEGSFSEGLYHGLGTQYFTDGTVRYTGEFLRGVPQGKGSFYNESGKLLYTGDVAAGIINYRALVNGNLSEVLSAFAESPKMFYTDTETSFLFEQASVIVTLDCRMRVDTRESTPTQQAGDLYYYMPGQFDGTTPSGEAPQASASRPSDMPVSGDLPATVGTPPPTGTPPTNPTNPANPTTPITPTAVGGRATAGTLTAPRTLATTGGLITTRSAQSKVRVGSQSGLNAMQTAWQVVGDEEVTGSGTPDTPTNPALPTLPAEPAPTTPAAPASSPATSPAPASDAASSTPVGPAANPGAATADATAGGAAAANGQASSVPDFVESEQTVYFEIDEGVWQTEDKLDAEKIRVKKVTVFTNTLPEPPANAVAFDDSAPPGLEECVAIELLRQTTPTAFSQVQYELQRTSRLVARMWNINYASSIERQAYLADPFTYRYAYQDRSDKTPLYFSVER